VCVLRCWHCAISSLLLAVAEASGILLLGV
jgi:hypothetical protein